MTALISPGRRLVGLFVVILAAALLFFGRGFYDRFFPQRPPVVMEERSLMGTAWSIQVFPPADMKPDLVRASIAKAYAELDRIERLMSEWRSDSPISAINDSAGKEGVEVPTELVAMIQRGKDAGELTQGTFDISWRGMGKLWNLEEGFVPPTEAQIRAAIANVDYRRIEVEGNRVSIPAGFSLGLGGIAKGYAIDRAAAVLTADGFQNFLVNGGGDILAHGSRGGTPWTVGIRDPRGSQQQLVARLKVTREAVVTSGDYERFVMFNGVRYHHIIDPRTGRPATLSRSVTVVSPQAEQADFLATAVFILGPAEGLQLVKRLPGTEAFVIDANGDYWMTEGFKEDAEFF